MKKKRAASVFFIAVFLIILYFGLFPYPVGREVVARPAWSLDLSAAASNAAPSPSADPAALVYPFRLGGVFGYVTGNGALVRADRTLYGVTISPTGFINYARMGTDWLMLDPRGGRRLSFSGNGYPVLSEDGSRVFVVSPDLEGIREIDGSNGDPAWQRDFPAVITSLSLDADHLLVGLLNGTLQLLTRHGAPVFQTALGGSRIPVVYGCSVSRDGSMIASVSGIDPQVLTILARSGSSYSVMEKHAMRTDFRREARITFSADSRYLVFEDRDAVGLFEPEEKRFARIGMPGNLAATAFLQDGRVAALASERGNHVDLRLVAPFLTSIGSESFTAADFSLGTVDGQLLLGIDGRLLRVDVGEL